MRPMPRSKPRYVSKLRPSFLRAEYEMIKQKQRDMTAKMFWTYLRYRSLVNIFVMPYYDAECAKSIHRLLPDATFYGCDQFDQVAENVEELPGGKVIDMVRMKVKEYVEARAGTILFDAAFLDYYGVISDAILFVDLLMTRKCVLALTVQGADAEGEANVVREALLGIAKMVEILYTDGYRTKHDMIHMIFRIEK
jgi:hypothetical protein